MSARTLCIAIRLKKQLAIPLSNHKTVAKWLVISWQTTPAKSLVMFEHAVRVPQPPDQTSNAGHPAGAANRGRLLLVTFLGKTRKVTDRTTSHLTNPANDAGLVIGYSCRATPGGVDFDFMSLNAAQVLLQPFAPNIILFATNFFTNGKQSSAVSAAARPALISGRSLENSRTSPSVKRIPASRSVRRWLR